LGEVSGICGRGLVGVVEVRNPQNTRNPARTEARLSAPYAITRRDDGILVEWDRFGHQALFAARGLRLACPCAGCVEEMTGRPLLDPAMVPADVRPVQVSLVGGYGLRVTWSDGHGTGIYTFAMLRAGCPCPRCRAGEAG
jgi:ATP-binding protein involved in chromosome partitioning